MDAKKMRTGRRGFHAIARRAVLEALESRAYFAAVVGTGQGLVADFFSDNNLANLATGRTDATVNFNWGTGAPPSTNGVPAEGFSVRWTGQVQAQFSETYTFYVESAGGARLFVNGQQVINDWTFHADHEVSGTVALSAGQFYDLKLEYRDQGSSTIRLRWSSPSTTKTVIPTTQLYRLGSGAVAGGWLEGDIGTTAAGSVRSTGPSAFTVTAPVVQAPTLAGLTLVNATTNEDIGPLADGATINLATTGSQLNVRADPLSGVGSVVFNLDGTDVRTESSPPLALFGDVGGSYNPWTPPVGAHTLMVTPYSASGGAGVQGTPLTAHFTVTNSTQPAQQTSSGTPPFAAHVNFQPAAAQVPAGYVVDSGKVFGSRAAGLRYGWLKANPNVLDRNARTAPDQRYDTFAYLQKNGTNGAGAAVWEIAVPNGTYQVHVVAGDPSWVGGVQRVTAEGVTVVNGAQTNAVRWLEGTATVSVSDGRLTFRPGAGAVNAKINFVDVTALSPAPVAAATPPPAASAVVSPNLGAAAGGLHFVYKIVRSDGTIVARVDPPAVATAAAEAGLLIRTDTNDASPYVDLHLSGDGQVQLQHRDASGAAPESGNAVAAAGPVWLKLVRDGNSFAGYLSPTGADGTWQLVGTAGVPMGNFAQFGLAVSGTPGVLDSAAFDNVAVSANAALGGNLDFQSDRVQDLPFVDLVKTTRGFYRIGVNQFANTDANGWPTEDFTFAAVDNTEWNVDVQPGTYKMSFNGPAGVAVAANSPVTVTQTGAAPGEGAYTVYTYDITVPAGVKKLQLTFTKTLGQVRNVRVLQPGYPLAVLPAGVTASPGAQYTMDGDTLIVTNGTLTFGQDVGNQPPPTPPTFTDAYLNLIKTTSPNVLRLMDWAQTNINPVAEWSQRTQLTDATQTKVANPGDLQASKGIAWEYAIELTNTVHKDVWVNVPARASDDYVRQLATLLKNTLAPDLNIYVEYSNEVWNAAFDQYAYNLAQAKTEVNTDPNTNLDYDGTTNSDTWADRRYARRVKQISDIFRGVWTGAGLDDPINTRVRVMLDGQASKLSRFDTELTYLNKFYGAPSGYLWGIGIAPYINMGASQNTDGLTKDQVLSALSASVDGYQNGTTFSTAFSKAAAYGLKLEAYEGGIDTYGPTSIAAKSAAVLDPQVQAIMTRYLNLWYARGGAQFNWFTIGARSYNTPYGTWAITDSYGRPNAPKILGYQQVRDAVPVNVTTGVVYG